MPLSFVDQLETFLMPETLMYDSVFMLEYDGTLLVIRIFSSLWSSVYMASLAISGNKIHILLLVHLTS
jgi:hypothetical protein